MVGPSPKVEGDALGRRTRELADSGLATVSWRSAVRSFGGPARASTEAFRSDLIDQVFCRDAVWIQLPDSGSFLKAPPQGRARGLCRFLPATEGPQALWTPTRRPITVATLS